MVWSKVRSNGTVFSLFLENKANFQKSGKLKRLKSSYSLSSCLFAALKVRHLRDQPLTDKQTDRQTDRQTNRQTGKQTDRQTDRQTTNRQTDKQTDSQTDRQTNRQTDKQSDYYNPLAGACVLSANEFNELNLFYTEGT